jgi:hypothetical protein
MTPIRDPAMRVTLVSSLLQEGLLPPFDKAAFYRDKLGKEYEFIEGLDRDVLDGILAMPIEDKLASLKAVQWDGGDELFYQIFETWDGHDRVFYVKDLSGIENCSGLEKVLFYSGLEATNLWPLEQLKSLRMVQLYGPSNQVDLRPLLKLPKLESVRANVEQNQVVEAAAKELRSRGVNVELG